MSFNHRSNAQVRKIIGGRLRGLRRSRGITQEQLAERAGLSRPTVSTLERGNDVSLDSFLLVLRALDLLDALDAMVTEPAVSPISELRRSPQQRPQTGAAASEWVWGDEQ